MEIIPSNLKFKHNWPNAKTCSAIYFRDTAMLCFYSVHLVGFVSYFSCGDGLVFPKTSGFQTIGNKVYSPYFDAFKLSGPDDTVEFQCRFVECPGPCNGVGCGVCFRV